MGTTCINTFYYSYRLCPFPSNKIQIRILNFIPPDPLYCSWSHDLETFLNSNDMASFRSLTDQIQLQANRRIGEIRFLDFRSVNSPSTNFDCIGPIGCISNNNTVEVITLLAKCYEYIAVAGSGGVTNPNCPGMVYYEECELTPAQCCVLSRKMCYDGGIVRVCETMTTGSGSVQCSGYASFTPPEGCDMWARTGCVSRVCQ